MIIAVGVGSEDFRFFLAEVDRAKHRGLFL